MFKKALISSALMGLALAADSPTQTYQTQPTSYDSQASSYEPQPSSYQSQPSPYQAQAQAQAQATNYQAQPTSYQPQATDVTVSRVPYPYAQGVQYQAADASPVDYGYQTSYNGFLLGSEGASALAPGYAAAAGVGGAPAFNPVAPLFAAGPLAVAYGAIVWILAHIPALLLGSVLTLGVCKFTPVCEKFSHFKNYEEFEEEVRSFATPARLARAADFVHGAINKYHEIQQQAMAKTEKKP